MWRIWGICCLGLAITGLAYAEPLPDALLHGVKQFRLASQEWSLPAMRKASKLLVRQCEANPQSADAHYWAGVAQFHEVLLLLGDTSKKSRRAADDSLSGALQALIKAEKLDSANPETHALLSTVHGMRIAGHPMTAVWRGPKSMKQRKLALASDIESPRTYYLIGMSYLFAPEFVGGVDKGLALLLEAERLFAEEALKRHDPLHPRWGYDHCLTFIGQVFEERGDAAKAESYFRRALKVNANHGLAREGLGRCLKQQSEK